jgi:hypothetical protein
VKVQVRSGHSSRHRLHRQECGGRRGRACAPGRSRWHRPSGSTSTHSGSAKRPRCSFRAPGGRATGRSPATPATSFSPEAVPIQGPWSGGVREDGLEGLLAAAPATGRVDVKVADRADDRPVVQPGAVDDVVAVAVAELPPLGRVVHGGGAGEDRVRDEREVVDGARVPRPRGSCHPRGCATLNR